LDASLYEIPDTEDKEAVKKFMNCANADVYEEHPEAKTKIIARTNYLGHIWRDIGKFGNFEDEEPDSYIFRGDVIKNSGLKTLHTFRVIVPSLIGKTKKAASAFPAPKKPVLRKPKWQKVKGIHPEGKGLNLMLKVIESKEDTSDPRKTWEVVAGDETGVVTLRLIDEEHAKVCQVGASVRIQNARVMMAKGFIRVIIDKWGVLKSAESPVEFDVKTDKDVSATEYELSG